MSEERPYGKFNHKKYTYASPHDGRFDRHNWEVVGPNGAIHYHASVDTKDDYNTTAGLEFHYIEAPEYLRGKAPHHLKCYLTGGRCWHDGTSLYATETLWPRVKAYLRAGEHKAVFSILESEYECRFEGEEDAADIKAARKAVKEDRVSIEDLKKDIE